jgi:hypothetical protein
MNVRDDLKAYVDGELSPERMEEVRKAVESDPALAQEVEFMRALGFEIKRLAVEPEVAGRAETLQKVKARGWPFWHPFGMGGRLLLAGGCGVLLLIVLFPVFAQSKDAAKVGFYRPTTSSETMAPSAGVDKEYARISADEDFKAKERFEGVAGGAPGRAAPAEDARQDPTLASPMQSNSSQPSTTPPIAEWSSKRMVIQNADTARRVESVDKAVEETTTMTKSLGGYVESSSSSGVEDQLPTASLILRIPAPKFNDAMTRIRAMGTKITETISGDDVTKQYADVEGRIRVLKAEEDSYVTMLRGARKIGEIIEIKDRLSQVRQELASYEQQRLSLKDLSSMSTISVRFEQRVAVGKPEHEGNAFQDSWATAVNGLKSVGTFLGQAIIFVFVFAPVWLPPVLLFWWLGKKAKA